MAQKELELLENVELRLALADTNAKFQKSLDMFLGPILLKLESPHDAVRNKVMAMCGHISKRLKSTPELGMPVKQLLDLFAINPQRKGQFVYNFALIYIEMAFARMKQEEAQEHVAALLERISERSLAQQQTILSIVAPVLANYKPPKLAKGETPTKDPFKFDANPSDFLLLLEYIQSLLLYSPIPPPKPAKQGGEPSAPATTPTTPAVPGGVPVSVTDSAAATPAAPAAPPVPPGMSQKMVSYVTNNGKAKWTASINELRTVKLGLVKLLQLSAIIPEGVHLIDRFFVFLIGSADANHEVTSASEDGLKRLGKLDLENEKLVKGLYVLYLGTVSYGKVVNPVEVRSPGTVPLKLRAIAYMQKSIRATNEFPHMLQTAMDALYGEETTAKLRASGMSFVQWLARMGSSSTIKPVAGILLAGLLKFIDETSEDRSQEGESIRGFAYEAVGMISKKAPEVVAKDLSVLELFFQAISKESRNVRVSVQEALSSMIDAFRNSVKVDETRAKIEEEILKNIHMAEPQARLVAVKYARALFPFSHPLSRYICIVASADTKIEVREEGRRGLEFPTSPIIAKFTDLSADEQLQFQQYREKLPDLRETLRCFRDMGKKAREGASLPGVRYVGSYTAEGYTSAVEFARKLFVLTAYPSARISDISPSITSENEEGSKISDILTRKAYKHYLQTLWASSKDALDDSAIGLYVSLVEGALKEVESDALLQSVASSCLLELISLGPSDFSNVYRDRIDWLKTFLPSLRAETRTCMARILGIVATADAASGPRLEQVIALLQELNNTVADQSKQVTLEQRHGALIALGYIIGRLYYRFPERVINVDLHKRSIATMFEALSSSSSTMVLGGCVALMEVGRYGVLLPEKTPDAMDVDDLTKSEKAETKEGTETAELTSVDQIVKKLKEFGTQVKDLKLQETAVTALGHIGVGSLSLKKQIIDFLFTLPPLLGKHIEVNFTVGEAVCASAFGFESLHLDEFLDIADVSFPPAGAASFQLDEALVADVLSRSLKDMSPTAAAVSRKGVCIWLLSFVKFCGKNAVVLKNLPEIHRSFSSLLSDRDEFTQEVASKGIGLVYELGDGSIKSSLVESLVSTISEGRRLAPQSVTGETQIFQEG
ncbi:hypothetical protein HDU96_003651, partial [Phlyctochytrium bullatum]